MNVNNNEGIPILPFPKDFESVHPEPATSQLRKAEMLQPAKNQAIANKEGERNLEVAGGVVAQSTAELANKSDKITRSFFGDLPENATPLHFTAIGLGLHNNITSAMRRFNQS